jgi:hypothetical protein
VPSAERRRGDNPRPHRLTAAEQQQITALAEAHLELPPTAQAAADALARTAPPRHVLADIRPSESPGLSALPQIGPSEDIPPASVTGCLGLLHEGSP